MSIIIIDKRKHRAYLRTDESAWIDVTPGRFEAFGFPELERHIDRPAAVHFRVKGETILVADVWTDPAWTTIWLSGDRFRRPAKLEAWAKHANALLRAFPIPTKETSMTPEGEISYIRGHAFNEDVAALEATTGLITITAGHLAASGFPVLELEADHPERITFSVEDNVLMVTVEGGQPQRLVPNYLRSRPQSLMAWCQAANRLLRLPKPPDA